MYSSICSNCGAKSNNTEQYCPECGALKQEVLSKTGFYDSLVDLIASKIDFLDNSLVFAHLILRTLILLIGVIIIPPFIRESELFWLAGIVYTIFAIIKEIEKNILNSKGIYLISKVLLSAYIGAGIGNLISHTGRNYNYTLSYYFNYKFLFNEILNKNSLVIIGAFIGVISLVFLTYYKNYFFGKKD